MNFNTAAMKQRAVQIMNANKKQSYLYGFFATIPYWLMLAGLFLSSINSKFYLLYFFLTLVYYFMQINRAYCGLALSREQEFQPIDGLIAFKCACLPFIVMFFLKFVLII